MRVKLADGRTAIGSDRDVITAPVRPLTLAERHEQVAAEYRDAVRDVYRDHVPHEGAPRRLIGRVLDV